MRNCVAIISTAHHSNIYILKYWYPLFVYKVYNVYAESDLGFGRLWNRDGR